MMIYFDNGSTSYQKPAQVAQGVAYAIDHLGNAGRSCILPALEAARQIYKTRQSVAALTNLDDPLCVAFTSSATESFNLVVDALVTPEDDVIVTVLEHNSVLRPLYRKGCTLSFLGCDQHGKVELDTMPALIKTTTKYVFATQGSNVLGNVTNIQKLRDICREHGLKLVLDVSQTMGHIPVRADMADVLCFTGHKALFGPQGTGGIIVPSPLPFFVTKTGGSGNNSFGQNQGTAMPDVFEAGTQNSHSLYGLQKGVAFILETTPALIQQKEEQLTALFWHGLQENKKICVYGTPPGGMRLPIVSLNIRGIPSEEVALRLWEKHQIATRPGIHCAPLLHKYMGTAEQGMVRFSFGYFNTAQEVEIALYALQKIAL